MNYNEIIKNIAVNLKKLRRQKSITQEKLIEDIGEENISLRSYKTYESGKSNQIPLLDKLIILAEYFDVSLDALVFSKQSTYDDSYTKKDSLKRLTRLIYSLALLPVKENKPENPNFGRYYFITLDSEVDALINRMESEASINNLNFLYKGNDDSYDINMFDKYINEVDDLSDDWSPTLKRMNYILMEQGINPEEFLKNHLELINKKRNIEKIKHN